jgi:putative transcriptional regulator
MSDQLAPGFLIAVPQLLDPNFRQSVVLLLQQNKEGAMGVVINHESELLLKDLCEDHEIPYAGNARKRVRRGGPVQPEQGLVLYGDGFEDPEGRRVVDGLHVSASRGTLTRLCDQTNKHFECYSGYAGWGPGQLEREISAGSWIIGTADPKLVFVDKPGSVWLRSLEALGIDPAALVPGGGANA